MHFHSFDGFLVTVYVTADTKERENERKKRGRNEKKEINHVFFTPKPARL